MKRVQPFIGKLIWNNEVIGTGFLVHESGIVATCYHVLREIGALHTSQVLIFQLLDSNQQLVVRTTNKCDSKNDVALLKGDEALPDGLERARLVHSNAARPGMSFYTSGFGKIDDPQGHVYDHSSATGILVGSIVRDDVDLLQLDSKQILLGMSGAPVIVEELGGVVGVISGRYSVDPKTQTFFRDVGWAARIEVLQELDQDIQIHTSGLGTRDFSGFAPPVLKPQLPKDSQQAEIIGEDLDAVETPEYIEPEMVYVPETPRGSFGLGISEEKVQWIVDNTTWGEVWFKRGYFKSEQPQVFLGLPVYWISKYPVTVRDFRKFILDGGYSNRAYWETEGKTIHVQEWKSPRGLETSDELDQHPVVGISYYEALAYTKWLSEKTQKLYSLPSEAQWEQAAKGMVERQYPWGDIFVPAYCNTLESGFGTTTAVGNFSPHGDSEFKCSDMAGNVWEWCDTVFQPYGESYELRGLTRTDPSEVEYVLRGGSFRHSFINARVTYRKYMNGLARRNYIGFRIALQK